MSYFHPPLLKYFLRYRIDLFFNISLLANAISGAGADVWIGKSQPGFKVYSVLHNKIQLTYPNKIPYSRLVL